MGCGSSTEARNKQMEDAWSNSRGNPNALTCDQAGETEVSEIGITRTVVQCTINISLQLGSVYMLTDGKLFQTAESRYLDFTTSLVDAQKGDKFEAEVPSEAGIFSKNLKIEFAVWNENDKNWAGSSNVINIVIPVDFEKIKLQQEQARQVAEEEFFSKWFDEGYTQIMDRDPETLYNFGISRAFGATGNPVESKMKAFCRSFTVFEIDESTSELSEDEKLTARDAWDEGCLSAGMSLSLP
jgi:hypothetical protein